MAATDELWDIRGRTVLVTGGTGGIGYAAARNLVRRGARVIITGRDADRGNEAAGSLAREGTSASATFLQADHATVGGNQRVGRDVRAYTARIDVLINNVGGLIDTRRETADGYEWTLAMNFVGPYALTTHLLPVLRASAPSRCVNVVSAAFRMWKRDPFNDVQSTQAYVGGDAYARSKLLNVLFGLALAGRLVDERITVTMVHPGVTWTRMTQSQTARTMPSWRWVWPVVRLIQRHGSPDKAARRVAYLASAAEPGARTGEYFERGPRPKRLSARELDPAVQEQAWHLGAQLVERAPTRLSAQEGPTP
ncbi:MAG TPA: SDR family NAD(P)-dependent oxidoreductase [Euzebyales bacterium]|nr:SDR family NAD(P)-dependent oxidoreductase [Euzebyales bacterium]